MVKPKSKVRAMTDRKPGGREWRTAAGRVFAGDENMGAILRLADDGTQHGFMAHMARVFDLAAKASRRSARKGEKWVICVESDGLLRIETVTTSVAETDRAAALLVKLLEGATK